MVKVWYIWRRRNEGKKSWVGMEWFPRPQQKIKEIAPTAEALVLSPRTQTHRDLHGNQRVAAGLAVRP